MRTPLAASAALLVVLAVAGCTNGVVHATLGDCEGYRSVHVADAGNSVTQIARECKAELRKIGQSAFDDKYLSY